MMGRARSALGVSALTLLLAGRGASEVVARSGEAARLFPDVTCEELTFGAACSCDDEILGVQVVVERPRKDDAVACTAPECGAMSPSGFHPPQTNYRQDGLGIVFGIIEQTTLRALLTRLAHVQFIPAAGETLDSFGKPAAARAAYWYPGPYVFNPRNNHYYQSFTFNPSQPHFVSWEDAQAYCASPQNDLFGLIGYLATATSAEEMDFIRDRTHDDRPVWLGGTKRGAVHGSWRWVTGPESGCASAFTSLPTLAARSACPFFPLPAPGESEMCYSVPCFGGDEFYTISGPVSTKFSNFAAGQPNASDPGLAYVAAYRNGEWAAFKNNVGDPRGSDHYPVPVCEWGGVGEDCLDGVAHPVPIRHIIDECKDRCPAHCANDACGNQTCVDGPRLFDWVCSCAAPATGSKVTGAAACVLDECDATCDTCAAAGACGLYTRCHDPRPEPAHLSDWTCVPHPIKQYAPKEWIDILPAWDCGAVEIVHSQKSGARVQCGCSNVTIPSVTLSIEGWVSTTDFLRCEHGRVDLYAVDVKENVELGRAVLTVSPAGGGRQPISFFIDAVQKLQFMTTSSATRPPLRVAVDLAPAYYDPDTRRYYELVEFTASTRAGADLSDIAFQHCGAQRHDIAGLPGYPATFAGPEALQNVLQRVGLQPQGMSAMGDGTVRRYFVGAAHPPATEAPRWVAGSRGCPPYHTLINIEDYNTTIAAFRGMCKPEDHPDCEFWSLGCGVGDEVKKDAWGDALNVTPMGGEPVILSVRKDLGRPGLVGELDGVPANTLVHGVVCEWGGVLEPCVAQHSLHQALIFEKRDGADCEKVVHAEKCTDKGQTCYDPNVHQPNDWECHCPSYAQGVGQQQPATCRLDECFAPCSECENGACAQGNAPQTCADLDQRLHRTGTWVCTCVLPKAGAAVAAAAVCEDPESIHFAVDQDRRPSALRLFPQLVCDVGFTKGKLLAKTVDPLSQGCNTPVKEAVIVIAEGYQPGDTLKCSMCAQLRLDTRFTVVENKWAYLKFTAQTTVSLRALAVTLRSVMFTPDANHTYTNRLVLYSIGPGLPWPHAPYRYGIELVAATTWVAAGRMCEDALPKSAPMWTAGYLATLTSALENAVVPAMYAQLRAEDPGATPDKLWIGATPYGSAGLTTWRWKTGPDGCAPYADADPTMCAFDTSLEFPVMCAGEGCAGGRVAVDPGGAGGWDNFTSIPTEAEVELGAIVAAVDVEGGWHARAQNAIGTDVTGVLCEYGGGGEFFFAEADVRGAVVVTAVLDECTEQCAHCAGSYCSSRGLLCIDPDPRFISTEDWQCICPFPSPIGASLRPGGLQDCSFNECDAVGTCRSDLVNAACVGQPSSWLAQHAQDPATDPPSTPGNGSIAITDNPFKVPYVPPRSSIVINLTLCADACDALAGDICTSAVPVAQVCHDPAPNLGALRDWVCICPQPSSIAAVAAAADCAPTTTDAAASLTPATSTATTGGTVTTSFGSGNGTDEGQTGHPTPQPNVTAAMRGVQPVAYPFHDPSVAAYVAGAAALVGGNVAMYSWHVAVGVLCEAPLQEAWIFHPTHLSPGGSHAVGMVVGNLVVVFGVLVISLVATAAAARCAEERAWAGGLWRRVVDELGILWYPTAPLLAIQFFGQGLLAGSVQALWSPTSLGDYLVGTGGTVALCCVAFSVFVLSRFHVAQHAVFVPDSGDACNTPSRRSFAAASPTLHERCMQVVLGSGEWVNRCPASGWVERHASVVRWYRPGKAWFWVVELGACALFATLVVLWNVDHSRCGHLAIAAGVLYFGLFGVEFMYAPRARSRDWWCILVILFLSGAAAVGRACGYMNEDPAHVGFVLSAVFSTAAEILMIVKVAFDALALCVLLRTDRRERLQQVAAAGDAHPKHLCEQSEGLSPRPLVHVSFVDTCDPPTPGGTHSHSDGTSASTQTFSSVLVRRAAGRARSPGADEAPAGAGSRRSGLVSNRPAPISMDPDRCHDPDGGHYAPPEVALARHAVTKRDAHPPALPASLQRASEKSLLLARRRSTDDFDHTVPVGDRDLPHSPRSKLVRAETSTSALLMAPGRRATGRSPGLVAGLDALARGAGRPARPRQSLKNLHPSSMLTADSQQTDNDGSDPLSVSFDLNKLIPRVGSVYDEVGSGKQLKVVSPIQSSADSGSNPAVPPLMNAKDPGHGLLQQGSSHVSLPVALAFSHAPGGEGHRSSLTLNARLTRGPSGFTDTPANPNPLLLMSPSASQSQRVLQRVPPLALQRMQSVDHAMR